MGGAVNAEKHILGSIVLGKDTSQRIFSTPAPGFYLCLTNVCIHDDADRGAGALLPRDERDSRGARGGRLPRGVRVHAEPHKDPGLLRQSLQRRQEQGKVVVFRLSLLRNWEFNIYKQYVYFRLCTFLRLGYPFTRSVLRVRP